MLILYNLHSLLSSFNQLTEGVHIFHFNQSDSTSQNLWELIILTRPRPIHLQVSSEAAVQWAFPMSSLGIWLQILNSACYSLFHHRQCHYYPAAPNISDWFLNSLSPYFTLSLPIEMAVLFTR